MAPGKRQTLTYHCARKEKMISDLLPEERLRGCATKQAAMYASGTIWPHGEWSLGWAKERADGGEWHEHPIGVSDRALEHIRDDWNLAAFPLDLSDAANSCKWPRRGIHGITGYGQQMIKACGHLMQEKWPHHRKTLGTITLPDMSPEARAEVVEAWPLLTRELLTWLTRRLKRLGLPQVVCSVTEVQPKRLIASGEGYLHWHLLWLNVPAKSGHWSVCPNDLRTWLGVLLRRHCPSYRHGFINVDTKKVEGVVAAYLAKYMSKGKQQVDEAMDDWGYGNTPRTWYNLTKPARDMVKAATLHGRGVGKLLEHKLYQAFEFGVDKCYAFLAPIRVDFDGVQVLMGWRGRFTDELRMHLELTEYPRVWNPC